MKQYTELKETFTRYIHGQLSREEAQCFLEHLQSGKDREVFEQFIRETIADPVQADQIRKAFLDPVLDRSWVNLQKRIGQGTTVKVVPWRNALRIAAAIMLVASVGLWFYMKRTPSAIDPVLTNEIIMPGQQTATLTLADGTQIRLAESPTGTLAKDGGVMISKASDGQLLYEIKKETKHSTGFNTLSTARGETYSVKLPDGTKIWLNAASTLIFPSSFEESAQRKIYLEGEGYFEVKEDPVKPFIVETINQKIVVLGTYFNVKSYSDEKEVITTLLQGSVQVNNDFILKPGEQLITKPNGDSRLEKVVNTSAVAAWRKGLFVFDNEDIYQVMRKLARWYNVNVVYEEDMPHELMNGTISKFESISKVLGVIEQTGLFKFEVKGRNITVRKLPPN